MAKPTPNPRRDLEKELAAAATLKEQLRSIVGDAEMDAATIRDTVEGETNLFETIDAIVGQIGEDAARIEGIDKFATTLEARKHRLSNRIETMRALLTNAMDILEVRKFERPIATITLKDLPRKVKITDEAQVPSRFYVQPDPVLSKKDLGDALKAKAKAMDALDAEFKSSSMTEEELLDRVRQINAVHPAILGAELDNGGVTVSIRFQ